MDPSNPVNLLIAGIYYVVAGIMAFFSIFAVYILIRYGQSKLLSLAIGVIYGFFFLTILAQSFHTLKSIG